MARCSVTNRALGAWIVTEMSQGADRWMARPNLK